MFNKTLSLKKLFEMEKLFTNSNEDQCTTTSFALKTEGCLSDLTGDVIKINEKNQTLAKTDSLEETTITFCVEARNRAQVVQVDNIRYT